MSGEVESFVVEVGTGEVPGAPAGMVVGREEVVDRRVVVVSRVVAVVAGTRAVEDWGVSDVGLPVTLLLDESRKFWLLKFGVLEYTCESAPDFN